MSSHRSEPPVLHIHAQRFPHDAVEVFGTSVGLERLINALIDGVNIGHGRCEFVARDGCEAEVHVACLDGRRREEEWRRSGSPYLDIADPLVARIMELTEEVGRLRQTVQMLRAERKVGTVPPG